MSGNMMESNPGLAGGVAARATPAASWPAIIAGAFVAAAASLILLALGSGLGFASISPWQGHGVSATTFTVTMAIWLIVTQWLSAALGGYIAGRLRNRWVGTHSHEVFFRDTAHGLVTWAVATVLVTVAVAMIVSSAASGALRGATDVVSAGAQGAASSGASALSSGPTSESVSSAYDIDRLFRPASAVPGMQAMGMQATSGQSVQSPISSQTPADARADVEHIIVNAVTTGGVPDADRSYLVGLVAARAGISQDDAQKRVDDLMASVNAAQTKLKAAADAAREAASQASLYTALSLLIGAFIASVTAALGGRLRDEHI